LLVVGKRSVGVAIRTVLFDLGNVLIRFSHDRMFAQIGELCGLPAAEVRRHLGESGLQLDLERGRVTSAHVHAFLSSLSPRSFSEADLAAACSDIFEPNPGMPEVVEQLKSLGMRLVLLSNTCEWHFEFVRPRYPLLECFDAFVLSYQAGAIKPEPRIFSVAVSQIGCDPAECLYTDDIPAYVAAGASHGLDAVIFTNAESLKIELRSRGVRV
jgi:putative hydrolase of the HAD superfamily